MMQPSQRTASVRKGRSPRPVAVTWFGHSAFQCVSPRGKVILIDPWLENPSAPPGVRDIERIDAILVTHGHSDHLGETISLAGRAGARVFAIHEVALFLQHAGVSNVVGMNISGSVHFGDLTITMVEATHSGGIESTEGVLPGGHPAGFVLTFDDGLVIYHAGDTGLFADMRLIAQMYKPDVALLPIGGLYTMGPREAAKACTMIKPRHILGMHYGTFPALSGTPAELRRCLPPPLKKRVHELHPGETLQLR